MAKYRTRRVRRSRTRRVRRARKTTRKGMRGGANECKNPANQSIYDALIVKAEEMNANNYNANNNMNDYAERPRATSNSYRNAANFVKNFKESLFEDDELIYDSEIIESIGNMNVVRFIAELIRKHSAPSA